LYYNIDHSTFDEIKNDIEDIHQSINKAKEKAKRVYFGKEPDHPKG